MKIFGVKTFETKKKILVIRLSSLGDVLLTTPILRTLKQKYPDSTINFLIKRDYADAVKYNPFVSKLFIYDKKNVRQLISEFKSVNFDFVVDLQNNFRSRKVTRALKLKTYKYSKPTIRKFLLVKFKINLLKNSKSVVQMYAEAIDDWHLDSYQLELFYPDEKNKELENNNYIGFCPGSKHFTKRWPAEYFIELGTELVQHGFKILIFGGKDDKDLCNEISGKIDGGINLQNNDDILRIAADMKQCKAVITNDSGLMHTASAVGVPVISIFGSSVKEFGFVPIGDKNIILENNQLICRPCSHIGRSECPKKHFKCMKEITPQNVNDQLQKLLASL